MIDILNYFYFGKTIIIFFKINLLIDNQQQQKQQK